MLYGSAGRGLREESDQEFTQDTPGVIATAVGVPNDSVAGAAAAGAVDVLYSTRGGVRAGADQLWTQDTSGVNGIAASFARFGHALAAADFDDDGDDDLAIGLPGGRINGVRAGAVSVLYSSHGRLDQAGDLLWSQGAHGIKARPEASDDFGWSLATGDVDQDGDVELAIGVPFEDLGGVRDAGAVNLLYSGRDGLKSADTMLSQASPGSKGAIETGDRFGYTLASADFDNDYEDDLAVGVPTEDIGGIADAGAVNVVYGSERTGLSRRDTFFSQASAGVKGRPGAFDNFGLSLAVGDFDGESHADLAIGVPLDRVGSFPNAGVVNVLHGRHGALSAAADQLWTQGTPGIKGAVGNDGFGWSLGAGGSR